MRFLSSGVTSTSVSSIAVVTAASPLGSRVRPALATRATGASVRRAELDGAVDVVGSDQLADLLEERLGVHRALTQEEDGAFDDDGDGDRRADEIDVHEESALLEEFREVLHVSSATALVAG